jgi:hypothetical protein
MTLPLSVQFAIFLAPIVVPLILWVRRYKRLAAQAERDALPFGPKPRPVAGVFLRRFSAPQQLYLREQFKMAGVIYLLVAWTVSAIFSFEVLDISALGHVWLDPSTKLWFMYVRQIGNANQFLRIVCLMGAVAAIMPLRFSQFAQFYRTRPLGKSFLFWARVFPLFVSMTLAIATGMVISFAVIAAVKGPIWQHLPPTIPRVLGPDDADLAQDYLKFLVTSPLVLALFSIVTTMLTFSAFLALVTLPLNRWRGRNQLLFFFAPVCFFAFIGPPSIALIGDFSNAQWPRIPFFYPDFGPPPNIILLAIPAILSVGLLLLAQFFVTRVEVSPAADLLR